MKISDIPKLRLYNQHITHTRLSEPGDIVDWLGAVQAQDYFGSLWGIGLRLKSGSESTIEKAIADKKIVRSWPMRGTLHFVPPADLRWMLQFLTPRVIQRSAGLYREAGLDSKVFTKSSKLLEDGLIRETQLTRNEIYGIWDRARITTAGQRGLHILGHLAQTGLICFGPRRGKQQTFVLLEEWLPASKIPQKDEALASLALTYFQSHGPATVHDFSWWSGLTIAETKSAVESVGTQLRSEKIDDQLYFMSPADRQIKSSGKFFLLPNYDEYFVAYKDRSAALDPKLNRKIQLPGYGIFTSPIILRGLMAGNWRRSFIKDKVLIEATVFSTVTKPERKSLESVVQKFGKFLKMPAALSHKQD